MFDRLAALEDRCLHWHRQPGAGGRVRRHGDLPVKATGAQPPGAGNLPVRRRQSRPSRGEAASGAGLQQDVLVPGPLRIDLQTGHHPVQPGADGAIGVMVERIHGGILGAALRRPAVPALPDGGGSLRDGIQPGRALFLVQELVGNVEPPSRREDVGQVRRAHESGREFPAALLNVLDEIGDHTAAQSGRHQVEMQG